MGKVLAYVYSRLKLGEINRASENRALIWFGGIDERDFDYETEKK